MTHSHHLDRLNAGIGQAESNQKLFPDSNAPARPRVARNAELLPTPVEPYSSIVETACDDCGGDGRDHGCRDDYETCESCGGSGKQAVLRNWLGEAFQIEEGKLQIAPQREHLRAFRFYATQLVNALNEPFSREVA